ncbi:MAG: hypothetical protein CVU84_10190 [Firmicutes bacterium HGW-Firmicutes-1]|jgi:flagellar basal body-associated protein FliL|nr:MAG: hypothetical protein CVU84_10190 [Firmicutes bacterium HGW-Firmicutes-1]
MKKFFSRLFVFLLVIVIIGGIGFIGYTYLNMNQTNQQAFDEANKTSNSNTTSQENVQQDTSMGSMQMNKEQPVSTSLTTTLKNKENLDKIRTSFKDALKYMTLDPYAANDADNQADMQMDMGNMQQGTDATSNTSQSITQQAVTAADTTMQNMGLAYDSNKMEQLHSGLFSMAVGMALLDQLSDKLIDQAAFANINTQNPIQDLTNQYNLTVQNKASLNQAMGYLEESAKLVNINPYISSDGFVYDKERMENIHQSVFKLAEGVALMNLLDNELTNQSIYLANTTQVYINNASMMNAANTANSTTIEDTTNSAHNSLTDTTNSTVTTTGFLGGIFDNINISSVVNIILIIFVIGLILGIFGFIMSLFKAPKVSPTVDQQHGETL